MRYERMRLVDLFMLAGAKNRADPDEIVRVRYTPTTRDEARDLLRVGLTIAIDATVSPPTQYWCAGFTDREVLDGAPAGIRIERRHDVAGED